MAISIINNVLSAEAQRQLSTSQMRVSSSLSRLSSGLRISTQDSSAVLDMAARMRAQISGASQSPNSANNAIAEVQTRDAELGEVSGLLNRMHELRALSDSGNLEAQDREALEKEFQANNNQINAIADSNNPLAYRPDYTAALGTRDALNYKELHHE